MSRAIKKNLLETFNINIRDFADNDYGSIDDYPYSGGPGMLIQAEPVYQAIQKAKELICSDAKVYYMSPIGKTFAQHKAREISQEENIILLCGHYEGIDQRVLDECVDENISVGDYVMTGGELASLSVLDASVRLIPGVLSNSESVVSESFSDGTLEHPQYTRPQVWHGIEVPEVLLSGNHKEISKWKEEKSLEVTMSRRPDLLENNE